MRLRVGAASGEAPTRLRRDASQAAAGGGEDALLSTCTQLLTVLCRVKGRGPVLGVSALVEGCGPLMPGVSSRASSCAGTESTVNGGGWPGGRTFDGEPPPILLGDASAARAKRPNIYNYVERRRCAAPVDSGRSGCR